MLQIQSDQTQTVHRQTAFKQVAQLSGMLLAALGLSSPAMAIAPFHEQALLRGVDYVMTGFPRPFGYSGFGCGFADLDNDGDQDIIILGALSGIVGIFENDGTGFFTDRSNETGIAPLPEPSALALADYDADGDLDLYITQIDMPNVLLRNDGGFVFTDVTIAARVADAGVGQAASWGDVNGDGLPDLHVSNYTGGISGNTLLDALFLNIGDGTFVNIAEAQGTDYHGFGFQTVWFDYDVDGDLDLYLSNDRGHLFGQPNHLWRNDDGILTDVSVESGAGIGLFSMGVACGDFDGNGYPDLYCTNVPGGGGFDNPLLLNLGDGTFVEASVPYGVNNPWTSWGSIFADFTNNGWLDLYVNNMFDPNTLFSNTGTIPCVNIAPAVGVQGSAGVSYCSAAADIDNDGDLDLLINNFDSPVQLFINSANNEGNWACFDVKGIGLNTFAIGARIDVRVGDRWMSREIYAGGNSFLGQNDLRAHFGLADDELIDEIRTTWPYSDATRVAFDLPVNRAYAIDPLLTADFDLDGSVGILELLRVLGEWGPCSPCAEDLNADGNVGIVDLLALLAQWTD